MGLVAFGPVQPGGKAVVSGYARVRGAWLAVEWVAEMDGTDLLEIQNLGREAAELVADVKLRAA